MGEIDLARRLILLLRDTTNSESGVAKALVDWIQLQRDWLWPAGNGPKAIEWESLSQFAELIGTGEPVDSSLSMAGAISDVLALDGFDRALLHAAIAFHRAHRLIPMRDALEDLRVDMPVLLGMLAGAEPGAAAFAVRASLPVILGLLEVSQKPAGGVDLETSWTFDKLLNRGIAEVDWLIQAFAGPRQTSALTLDDFSGVGEVELLVRLLKGAIAGRETGINILIHGPPGTGKTELARTLAAATGAALHAVGEVDEEGDEPSRFDRISALRRAQRVLARCSGTLLLFDEMEDLIGDTRQGGNGYSDARMGSKIFINRMLESNPIPVIWTSNAISMIDAAHLRRMSFVLKLDHPRGHDRMRVLARIAAIEEMPNAAEPLACLAREAVELPSIARVALRSARIAGGDAAEASMIAGALVRGLRDEDGAPLQSNRPLLDLDLFESDPPVAGLVARLTARGAPMDFSMLLTGPPGTGKTALVGHVARGLDRPLHVKRTSDVLSKWVGETEKNIADAFEDARREGAVLLFDEVDSLLFDRADATRSWEVAQVNELLTWLDGHSLPVFAATNHPGRLDPAALRRFVFKLSLGPLSPARARRAFVRFFGTTPPAGVPMPANLTPGDFAVVKRQLRFNAGLESHVIVALLEAEAGAKPGMAGRIGF
jgi:transitional endoplasmic reticulum ATPase